MQKSLRQKDDGTYFVGQYELTVRQSDDVAVAAGNGKGIGLTKAEWFAKYGPNGTEVGPMI